MYKHKKIIIWQDILQVYIFYKTCWQFSNYNIESASIFHIAILHSRIVVLCNLHVTHIPFITVYLHTYVVLKLCVHYYPR